MMSWGRGVGMFKALKGAVSRLALLLILVAAVSATARAQGADTGKIWPTSASMTGPKGETYLAIPLQFYFEYGYGQAKSTSDPINIVDVKRNRYTFGADFMTSSFLFWGTAVSYTKARDNGSNQTFVTTIDTDKKFVGGSFYVAKYIVPSFLAGVSVYYNKGSGRSVYGFVDVNNEKSRNYGFSPYVQREFRLSDVLALSLGAGVTFNYANFDYDANVPPTSSTKSVVARLPVSVVYKATSNVSFNATAQLNQFLKTDTFNNVPKPDPTTMTLTGGATFALPNGIGVYGSVSHDFFDRSFNSTRYKFGVSVPFAALAAMGRQSPQ